jgi:DNA-binding NtrC family response regulator
MPQILVIDDNPDILDALDLLLGLHGYQVQTASNVKHALLALAHQSIDLVIQDMNFAKGLTSGDAGKSLFMEIKTLKPEVPIILITAWAQLETAIELVKAGATDYLQKPWDDNKLLELVAEYSLKNKNALPDAVATQGLIYQSPEMHALMHNAAKVADAEVNVLITGANGSGKERLADYIHQHSRRKNFPFIKVNMGALPQELMEAELFGAEKGAFTGANQSRIGRFEAAHNGTLFLDEIGNLPLSGQMKLLRVLQTGEFERLGSNQTLKVNVRVLSATNANIALDVKQGLFREDLYYRLNVIELHLPPLKERKGDIIPLARHFIGSDYCLSDDAKQYLLSNTWQGNVRELENACKRAIIFAKDKHITQADFVNLQQDNNIADEKKMIEAILNKHAGVIKHAAIELGMSRQALYRRIEKYHIEI